MQQTGVKQTTDVETVDHDRPKTESAAKVFFKMMIEAPSILWRLRNIKKVKSTRHWFVSRNNEAVELIMFGVDDGKAKNLIAADFGEGKSRSLFDRSFKGLGRIIACTLDCYTFSVASRHQLKKREATDYQDGFEHLLFRSPEKNRFNGVSGYVVISGGGNDYFGGCVSEEFIKRCGVRAGTSISTFAFAVDEYEYVEVAHNDPNQHPNTKRILNDYFNYSQRFGNNPERNRELAIEGSPGTWAPKVKVPTLLVCGLDDNVVIHKRKVPAYDEKGELVRIDVYYDRGTCQLNDIMTKSGRDVTFKPFGGENIHAPPENWFRSLREMIGLVGAFIETYRFMKEHLKA
ncbi:Uncharacterised protein [uncultured archaeon]|nr:Uncharacterised protein [uncultured archaeon]